MIVIKAANVELNNCLGFDHLKLIMQSRAEKHVPVVVVVVVVVAGAGAV